MKTFVLLVLLGIYLDASSAVVKIPIFQLPRLNASKIIQDKSQPFSEAVVWESGGYLGNITVGTPPQQFTVLLDTSASGFWISDVTDSTANKTFNSKLSSTYQKNGSSFSTYVLNKPNVTGFLGVDTLTFVGADGNSVSVANVTFGQVTSNLDWPREYDGVLGLRPVIFSGENISPLLQAVNEGVFSEYIVTTYLSAIDTDHLHGTGVLTIGGIDADHCSDNVIYTNWKYNQFNISNVYAGNFSSQELYTAEMMASDSHPFYLYIPTNLIHSIIAQTGGKISEGIVVKSLDNVPDIVLTVNGKNLTIFKEDFAFPDPDGYVLKISDLPDTFVLQDAFIRSYCTVYNYGKKLIGFADVKK